MYEIIKKISETTFLALKGNNVFVLKRTDNEEAQLYNRLGEIRHKNIVSVYGTTVVDERLYAVYEYVSGVTLEEYIRRSGTLNDEETRKIAAGLCDGLTTVHESGIVHRDIKPGNVIITKSGDPVIIDFGISRIVKKEAVSDTYILGTHGYAAPEQFGFHQSTIRTDIYAMGVLINYMKEGCLPTEKMAEGAFREIVEKCIKIDETNRYASADELKRAVLRKKTDLKQLKKIIYFVPGFKRDSSAVTAVSAIYYSLCILLIAFAPGSKGIEGLLGDRIPMLFMFVIPYFIMWDIGSFTSKLGVSKEKNKTANLIVRIAVSIISVVMGALFISFFATNK